MTRRASEPVALIVEREGPARELAAEFLRSVGWPVEFASDGALGWERVQVLHPRLVVTEILVPKLDGLALCRRIKSDSATHKTSVLVVSVLAATARAREAGADGFLSKPLSEARLVDEVTRICPPPAAVNMEGSA